MIIVDSHGIKSVVRCATPDINLSPVSRPTVGGVGFLFNFSFFRPVAVYRRRLGYNFVLTLNRDGAMFARDARAFTQVRIEDNFFYFKTVGRGGEDYDKLL